MDTNLALRIHAWRLIQRFGVNQKVIAARMTMSESAFSRWLNGEHQRPATVAALDGLRQLLSDLQREATLDVTALPQDERDRLEAELSITKAERRLRPSVKNALKKRRRVKGTVRATGR